MDLEQFKTLMKASNYKVKIKRVKFSVNGMYGTGLGVYDGDILINPSCISNAHYNKYEHVLPVILKSTRDNFYQPLDLDS